MTTMSKDSSRRLRPANLFWFWSAVLWAPPLMFLAVASFLLDGYAGAGVTKLDRGTQDFQDIPIVSTSISWSMVILWWSTIAYAIWSQMLRTCGIRHAALYAVSAWVLGRVIWWLPQVILDHPLLFFYSDRLTMFGGETGIVVTSLFAAIGAGSAIYLAYHDKPHLLIWGSLMFAAPFVAMSMVIITTSDATPWEQTVMLGDTCALGILGFVFFLRSATMRDQISGDQCQVSLLQKLRRTDFIEPFLVASCTLIVVAARAIWIFWHEPHAMIRLTTNWLVVVLVSVSVLVLCNLFGEKRRAVQWMALMCLLSIAIVTYLDWSYFDSINYSDYVRNIESLSLFSPKAPLVFILMFIALLISLSIDIWHNVRPFLIGAMFPALLMFSLAKPAFTEPSDVFDLLLWFEPTIVLIVVFGIMFGVFCRSAAFPGGSCEDEEMSFIR